MNHNPKAGTMKCAECLFQQQELEESVAEWQEHDEDLNLEIINQHEASTLTEKEAACLFTKELNKRNIK